MWRGDSTVYGQERRRKEADFNIGACYVKETPPSTANIVDQLTDHVTDGTVSRSLLPAYHTDKADVESVVTAYLPQGQRVVTACLPQGQSRDVESVVTACLPHGQSRDVESVVTACLPQGQSRDVESVVTAWLPQGQSRDVARSRLLLPAYHTDKATPMRLLQIISGEAIGFDILQTL